MQTQIPFHRYPDLKPLFDDLEDQKKKFIDESYKLATSNNGTIYEMDFFVLSIFKRSIDLIDGVIALVNLWNFAASAPLLRIHIDSLLRLNYMIRHEPKRAEVIGEWMDGKRFDSIKGSKKEKLRDIYLRGLAEQDYPWIKNVYEETSALVHLSSKHFNSLIQSLDKKSRKVSISIQIGVPDWPKDEIMAFILVMKRTSICIIELAAAWIDRNKDL